MNQQASAVTEWRNKKEKLSGVTGTNSTNLLVVSGLDEVVGEQADAVLTVSDDVDLLPPGAEGTVEKPDQGVRAHTLLFPGSLTT